MVGLQVLKDTKYLSLRTRGDLQCHGQPAQPADHPDIEINRLGGAQIQYTSDQTIGVGVGLQFTRKSRMHISRVQT